MRILFALNHPAHYYLFKFIIKGLKNKGHNVEIVIKEKDILEKLLILEGVHYTKISQKKNVNSKLAILLKGSLELLSRDINLLKFVRNNKPSILVGTDIAITHIGRFFKIPSLVYNEDDFEINKFFCKLSYPFASAIIAPEYTSVGKYEKKKISYNGIQKMAYLSSNYYKPNDDILKIINLNIEDKFVIIRLVSLTAGHDIEGKHTGLTKEIIEKLIPTITSKARLFITGEDNLPPELEKYRLKIPVNRMHDLMSYATLFIGDSQSMCAEAGILGVPFIRFNDFVGKIQYLNDIENTYNLGWGVKTDNPERLFVITNEVLSDDTIKAQWQKKKRQLFSDKIDLVSFSVWLIENFPVSWKNLQTEKDIQNKFKYSI